MDPSIPPPRATALFARTVVRQLRQAGYGKSELVGFVNELLEHITVDPGLGPMTGVTDVETALPNTEAFLEALEFELRRTKQEGQTVLLCCDIELPDSCADDAAAAIHRDLARHLRRGIRPTDTVARLGLDRYAIVLSATRFDRVSAIASRLLGPVVRPRRKEDTFPAGTRIAVRAVAANEGEAAVDLLARCLRQSPGELGVDTPSGATALVRTIPPPGKGRAADVEDDRIVLALGGGAARAAAHVGVFRALEAAGLHVAGVAGTSAGAVVGAMVLRGMKHDEILNRFLAFTRSTIYREMRRRYVAYRRASNVPRTSVPYFRESGIAFLSNEQLAAFDDSLLEAFVTFFVGPDRDISSLEGPFVVAATDLVTGRSIHISHGPLHHALRASCALPGLFHPQADGDRWLIDGSTITEVPVVAAVGLATGLPVVAVHLARPERRVTLFRTSSEVVTRSASIVHKELVREQLRHAHQLVTAPVAEIGWLEFRRATETATLGEQATRRHIEEMRRSKATT